MIINQCLKSLKTLPQMLLASPRPIRITKIIKMKITREGSSIEITRLADAILTETFQSNVMRTVTVQASFLVIR